MAFNRTGCWRREQVEQVAGAAGARNATATRVGGNGHHGRHAGSTIPPPRRAPQRLHQKEKGEKSDESKLATTPASRRRGRSGRVAPEEEEMGEGKQGVRCGRIWASGACQPPASGAASRAWPGKAVAVELRIWKATTRGVRACHAPCGDGGTRAREHGCWSARSKGASARGGGGTGPWRGRRGRGWRWMEAEAEAGC